jgi:hypothetical protein
VTLVKALEWQEEPHEWLLDGLISSAITVISGEPKSGKSLFMGYVVNSLITQTALLNIQPKSGKFKIAWMGFDSYWAPELKGRFPNILDRLYFGTSIHSNKMEAWRTFGQELCDEQIDLLVIDHLYGLAEGVDLDESHEWDKAVAPLKWINTSLHIPVVLVAQAGKNGTGRAAHSISIEGTARHILRLTGNLNSSTKTIVTAGNYTCTAKIKMKLTPELCELVEVSNEESRKERNRTGKGIHIVNRLLNEAPPECLISAKAAGKWLYGQGLSTSEEGGRSAVSRMIKGQLLARTRGNNSPLGPGPKLRT